MWFLFLLRGEETNGEFVICRVVQHDNVSGKNTLGLHKDFEWTVSCVQRDKSVVFH